MSESNMQKMQSASDYTPTTEEVTLPPLNAEVIKELALLGLDQMVVDVDDEKAKQFLAHVDRWLAEVRAQAIGDAIAYLKTTPAVTLSGQGGAYELLEAYAQKLEDNGN